MLYAERHRARGVVLAGAVHRTWAVAEKNYWQFSNPRIDTGTCGHINVCLLCVTHLDETSHTSAEFVFYYGQKCMGGLILPILVLLHL